MDAFKELRRQAREKRDKAVNKARTEYDSALVRIASLEQDILGQDTSSHTTIASCINSVIPTDRTFTNQEIMASLEAMDDTRQWRKRSVDNHIIRLREKGIVRRVKRSQGDNPAIYARSDFDTDGGPLEDMTLIEVLEKVMAGREPMRIMELMMATLEAGYQSVMNRASLRTHIRISMNKKPDRFICVGGKWRLDEVQPEWSAE